MVSDFNWATRRLLRKAAADFLPVELHWKIASAWGRLFRSVRGVPSRVRENVQSVFGDDLAASEIDDIARRNTEFVNSFTPLKDIFPRLCRRKTKSLWKIEGTEYLEESLAAGRGAILLTAHLGYSKFITPILRSHGYHAVSVVAKSLECVQQELRIERWLESTGSRRARILHFLRRTPYERNCIAAQLDIRPILSALAANRPVVLAGDGLKAAEFAQLPLLGGSYPFPKGFMKIAMLAKAAILPAFALEGDDGHRIVVHIGPPLEVDPEASVEANLMKFAQVLEEQIRGTPHLWFRWPIKEAMERIGSLPVGKWLDRWNRGSVDV
jgi:KDO2-lipid IV(A) lauroyltransferase